MNNDFVEGKNVFLSTGVEDTDQIAKKIADSLEGGEFILLSGELGAGKTTFTKALFKYLGVADTVTSPTFTIMKNYQAKGRIVHHMDMYRITNEDEVEELGLLEDIGKDDITVIEWNKFTELDGKVCTIKFDYLGETERKITIEGIDL